MMYWGHPFGWGVGLVMVMCMVIFWGGLIALAVWGIRRLSRHNVGSNSNALDIVKERYAKGEITKEQYEALKKDLS